MFRLIYNLALLPLAVLATPFWLWKTHKRGGLSARLLEKVARYDAASPAETEDDRGPIYLHAVSVGEVNIARKLITLWAETSPETRFLLAVGTSTGFDLAEQSPPPRTEVLYAPLDWPLFVEELLQRYRPVLVVLIEHEVWPNLMTLARRHEIPVTLVNARLSERSGRRLKKLRCLLEPFYQSLSWVGAQSENDVPRLTAIGIREESLMITGSVKFDPAFATPASSTLDAAALLESLGTGPVLMALCTHPGEELLFARAASPLKDCRLVIIPRHMERREEIIRELNQEGFQVHLRSTDQIHPCENPQATIFLVDSTGEMPTFIEEADLTFVGKSLLAHGGQNPCESIAAKVPVIAGPHFGNFEPLVSDLREAGGITTVKTEAELTHALQTLLQQSELRHQQAEIALKVLESHRGATKKTVEALAKLSQAR